MAAKAIAGSRPIVASCDSCRHVFSITRDDNVKTCPECGSLAILEGEARQALKVEVVYGEDFATYSVDGVCYAELVWPTVYPKPPSNYLSAVQAQALAACLWRASEDAGLDADPTERSLS